MFHPDVSIGFFRKFRLIRSINPKIEIFQNFGIHVKQPWKPALRGNTVLAIKQLEATESQRLSCMTVHLGIHQSLLVALNIP